MQTTLVPVPHLCGTVTSDLQTSSPHHLYVHYDREAAWRLRTPNTPDPFLQLEARVRLDT